MLLQAAEDVPTGSAESVAAGTGDSHRLMFSPTPYDFEVATGTDTPLSQAAGAISTLRKGLCPLLPTEMTQFQSCVSDHCT